MDIALERVSTTSDPVEALRNLLITELDLGYDKRQNILLSCRQDGCTRINYCSCDCDYLTGW